MSLAAPISIKTELERIGKHLSTWAKARGGTCKMVENLRHLWEEIFLLESNPRIILCYNGENSRGSFAEQDTLHRVDREFKVVVMKGHGFKDEDGNTELFYDSVEAIREQLRIITNISEEFPINYRGVKPLPNVGPTNMANTFMDAYEITFTTANDIPAVSLSQ